MTVAMMIHEPIDKVERDFYLCVCVERIHREILEPIAIEEGLTMVDNWGTYQIVDASTLDEFLAQMKVLMNRIVHLEDTTDESKDFLTNRMRGLVDETTRWIKSRPGLAVWIG
ncbi:hypothetical protein INH39_26970 [Massilia violaceinigra]|uniref:Uncharacterized protein n=1 Tax=Massilia violaceinigra TaxID=2045208 RepID=A0ABY4A8U5_9BURK|nr:hypothetical protein [Massilia violaceinigra]UOD29033.1 hypothetical protein INH39_26970 [Massilia violaceinigra]